MAKKKTKKKARKKTGRKKLTRTRRSPEEKRAILNEYDAAERGNGKRKVLAKHRVYQSQMSRWRGELGAPAKRAGKSTTRKAARKDRVGRRASDLRLQEENERLRSVLTRLFKEGKITVDDIL